MKYFFTLLFFCCVFCFDVLAQQDTANGQPVMKQYYFVMYTKRPTRNQDSVTAARIQQNHLQHLDSLYKAGLLNVAGPFLEESDWRGILIFDVASKEEAERYVQSDPAVAAGRLQYTILPWMTQQGNCFK